METLNRYQRAAMVKNRIARENSIKRYYENPVICKECNKVIEVREGEKVSDVKKRIFCSKTCSATHNNKKREKKVKQTSQINKKKKFDYLLGMTKKDLLDLRGKYYLYRSTIRNHAHYIYNQLVKNKKCHVCDYDKHIEVCHIKSVSSFDENSKIVDINNLNNLIGLCPNHHWEFDNGLIKINYPN